LARDGGMDMVNWWGWCEHSWTFDIFPTIFGIRKIVCQLKKHGIA
jgi:hypothetical protein